MLQTPTFGLQIIIYSVLLAGPHQSSSSTMSPLELIFLQANSSSCKGLARVIPLAEMARVRI